MFNPVEYKKNSIRVWDEIALRYHKRWAGKNTGPFKSTSKLLGLAKIKPHDTVLDLACGTGIVTKKLAAKAGTVIGTDTSLNAVKLAKKWNAKNKNVGFVVADAERIRFAKKFDVIVCQFALFFFPDSQKVLHNARSSLKKNGMIVMTVHGKKDAVPYFSCILDAVIQFIPDYIQPNAPSLDRFGTKTLLKNEFSKAGFKKIKIKEYDFKYSPGTFSDYWNAYLRYIAKPLREKINKLSKKQKIQLRDLVRKNTLRYTKNNKIIFPWKILIVTAVNA